MTYGEFYGLLNPLAAFAAGAMAGVHCVGMCGPLSCSLLISGGRLQKSATLSYAGGRLLSYSACGALAGWAGAPLAQWAGDAPLDLLPWGFVVLFLALAFRWDVSARRFPWWGKATRPLVKAVYRLRGWQRGVGLGVVTPLLPCGPLYIMLWVAALSGNAGYGSLLLLVYGLGTMPLMLAGQMGLSIYAKRAQPQRLALMQRSMALAAVAFLLIRSSMDLGLESLLSEAGFCF